MAFFVLPFCTAALLTSDLGDGVAHSLGDFMSLGELQTFVPGCNFLLLSLAFAT